MWSEGKVQLLEIITETDLGLEKGIKKVKAEAFKLKLEESVEVCQIRIEVKSSPGRRKNLKIYHLRE